MLTASRRHAGGVAARMLEESARSEIRIVDFMANMLWASLRDYVVSGDFESSKSPGWAKRRMEGIGTC